MSRYLEAAQKELGAAYREATLSSSALWFLQEAVKDILYHLESLEQQNQEMREQLMKLEALELSTAQPPTTEPATTSFLSDAGSAPDTQPTATDSTTPTTPLLQRLLGALTEAERTHVEQCSGCMVHLERLESSLLTMWNSALGAAKWY